MNRLILLLLTLALSVATFAAGEQLRGEESLSRGPTPAPKPKPVPGEPHSARELGGGGGYNQGFGYAAPPVWVKPIWQKPVWQKPKWEKPVWSKPVWEKPVWIAPANPYPFGGGDNFDGIRNRANNFFNGGNRRRLAEGPMSDDPKVAQAIADLEAIQHFLDAHTRGDRGPGPVESGEGEGPDSERDF